MGRDRSSNHLMVIYMAGPPRAIYFDSEGHTIRYNLSFPSSQRVVFESEPAQPGPQYRLSYWLEGAALQGKFEIAGKGAFTPYMSWSSKRP